MSWNRQALSSLSLINKSLALCLVLSLLTSLFLLFKLLEVSSFPEVKAQATETLPAGAVVPFNLAACPTGWSEFTSARGRTIIGTNPTAAGGISVRTLGQLGGAETHVLSTSEMPAHNHTNTTADPPGTATGILNTTGAMSGSGWGALTSSSGVRWATAGMANAGGGQAHNNMPPFVALLYCVKT